MPSIYKNRKFAVSTTKSPRGLFREIISPAKIRIPLVYKSLNHDYIETYALWDTGATNSVISTELAERIKLPIIDKAQTTGVHGTNEVNVYLLDFFLMNNIAFNNRKVTSGKLSYKDGVDNGKDIGILIGMDIIALCDFTITQELNTEGIPCTIVSVRYPSAQIPINYYEDVQKFKKEENFKENNKKLRKAYRKNKKHH